MTYTGVTQIFIDNVTTDGWLATGWYDTFDDSSSTIKGYITLQRASTDSMFLVYAVNSVTPATGYYKIGVSYVAGSFVGISNFAPITVSFSRTGDKGDTGATGAQGAQGPSGVVTATAPITYNAGTQTVGITQSALAISSTQITYPIADQSTNYTILATDEGRVIRSTGSAITITIADVLQIGEQITFAQYGAGQITFAPGTTTLHSVDNKRKTNKQYAGATLVKVAANTYWLFGDLVA